jgi:aryl-alcohol dehydrogenase-like predicted oxidoreductase
MEIVIGTATFGTDYGVANKGRVQTKSKALAILVEAQHLGVFDLDTSPEYQNAEEIIGNFHTSHPKFNCYSKISRRMLNSPTDTLLSLGNSLKLMNIDSLSGLYFHNPDELLAIDPEEIENLIDSIEETDRVRKIGASVYELEEILKIRERHPRITLFQVPENIADQRLRHSDQIESLHERGVEFHVRSIFLQGLLLMKNAPAHLAGAQPFLDGLNEAAQIRNCSPLHLCLSYVKQLGWASKFVIGVSEATQLHDIKLAVNFANEDVQIEAVLPELIRDPRKWHHE